MGGERGKIKGKRGGWSATAKGMWGFIWESNRDTQTRRADVWTLIKHNTQGRWCLEDWFMNTIDEKDPFQDFLKNWLNWTLQYLCPLTTNDRGQSSQSAFWRKTWKAIRAMRRGGNCGTVIWKENWAVVFLFCLCFSWESVGETGLPGFDECNYALKSAAGVNSLPSQLALVARTLRLCLPQLRAHRQGLQTRTHSVSSQQTSHRYRAAAL